MIAAMYTVAVKRDFVAQHFLIGGDWGPENFKHSHHYAVEVQLDGPRLDKHGYLVDIDDIAGALNALVARFKDKLLNEEPEFAGLNPSVEHFSRIFWELFTARISAPTLSAVTVKIWENDIAWAAYRGAVNE